MTTNETLAQYSDWAFRSAFTVLALALVLLIVQYASTRAQAVQDRELVAAGAGAPPAADATVPGRLIEQPKKPLSERFGGMGAAVLVVGTVLIFASIVLRGFATERFPLGNMYEFVTMACAAALVVGLALLSKPAYRAMWVFLLVPVLILMFLAATVLYADAAPVVPALRSYWLPIHVTIVSVGSGVFLVSGIASLLFLLRMRYRRGEEGTGVFGRIAERLPAWGRFWGWDPKETMSFIAWVIYAAYLHARATSGWRDTKAAWINVAGFVAMLFNLFIINMVVSGLHSYAGLN
jgi:ABC-type transport system involved in cytochrome c biogenesis permease subunit